MQQFRRTRSQQKFARSMPQSAIASAGIVRFSPAIIAWQPAPPLLQSGAAFSPPDELHG